MDAGVPLIVYDRFIQGLTPDAEISGDNVAIGEGAGRYFNEYFKEDLAKGQVDYLEFKEIVPQFPWREPMDSSQRPVQSSILYSPL